MNHCQTNFFSFLQFVTLSKFSCLSHGLSLREQTDKDQKQYDCDFGNDDAQIVRSLFCRTINQPPHALIRCQQTHESNIEVINQNSPNIIKNCDGVCTNISNIPMIMLGADCLLMIIYDPNKQAVGLAHAGWRGTVSQISKNLVRTMQQTYQCNPNDLHVGLGPAICKGCYEVGPEVIDAVNTQIPSYRSALQITNNNHGQFDLAMANKLQLIDCGIPESQIELSNICTKESAETFHSFRRDKQNSGRWALICGLLPNPLA